MAQVEDIMQKMKRLFGASDEYTIEFRNNLTGIRKKVDTHAISIKHIEFQMALLSAAVNTWKPGTLPSNSVQNLKNYGHCMAITTLGGKQTIDPTMPSSVENIIRYDDIVVQVSGELEYKTVKDVEVPKKVPPCLEHRLLSHKG